MIDSISYYAIVCNKVENKRKYFFYFCKLTSQGFYFTYILLFLSINMARYLRRMSIGIQTLKNFLKLNFFCRVISNLNLFLQHTLHMSTVIYLYTTQYYYMTSRLHITILLRTFNFNLAILSSNEIHEILNVIR